MKRRLFSLVLALILVASILPVGTAAAAPKAYGNVYAALNQPLFFDWSEYASYGVTYSFILTELKTKTTKCYAEKSTDTWIGIKGSVKGSFMATVQFFDASGNQTKEISDFFHFGAVFVAPDYYPSEKIAMYGVLAKDAKKYPPFSKKQEEAYLTIFFTNFFAFDGNEVDPNLWLNKEMNLNFTLDSINVIRKGYSSSKYDYNQLFEYNLFTLVNEYRLLNGKPKLLWNDALGSFGRLRATAASDNPMKNNTYNLSEIGDSTNSLIPDFYRYGLAAPSEGEEWFWTDTRKLDWDGDVAAQAIFDRWLSDESMRADMLGDFKYVGIGAVKCNRLLGKKQTGIAMMVEFEN